MNTTGSRRPSTAPSRPSRRRPFNDGEAGGAPHLDAVARRFGRMGAGLHRPASSQSGSRLSDWMETRVDTGPFNNPSSLIGFQCVRG